MHIVEIILMSYSIGGLYGAYSAIGLLAEFNYNKWWLNIMCFLHIILVIIGIAIITLKLSQL